MHKQTRVLALLLTLAMLLLPTIALADTAGTITGNDVNLRTGPSTATARLTYLYRGDNVRVTGESGNWYAVTYGDLSGYVYKTYVSLQAPPSSGSTTLLRSGSRGSAVKQLQEQLILLGYLNDRADGIFGRGMQWQGMSLWMTLRYGPTRWITSSWIPTIPGRLFFLKELAGPLIAEAN